MRNQPSIPTREVIIIGGGLAGLSAAIYLARAQRDTLVIDSGHSMAVWEPDVQNYLGFPGGIAGEELLRRGQDQARRYGAELVEDQIDAATLHDGRFTLTGKKASYQSRRLLLATGIYHIPPEIEGVEECIGHSMFFCKDCDGYRVRGKTIFIYGWNNEAVEYALAMLHYSPAVAVATDGRASKWDAAHDQWLREYAIPVYAARILRLKYCKHQVRSLLLADGQELFLDALFTTRGDIYFNKLATNLGAKLDAAGQIEANHNQATTVPGLYAAGCVTPANCQMIIAAGQGAVAAQAINRDLFEESLATHSLRRFRAQQLTVAG